MNQNIKPFELNIVPGWIHAKIAPAVTPGTPEKGGPFEAHIPFAPFSAEEAADIVKELSGHPYELYALLRSRPPLWLEEDVKSRYAPDWARAECGCGKNGCGHVRAVLAEAERKFQDEPVLRLTLLGLPKERLLNDVFRDWAERVPPAAESDDSEALGKLEEKGKAGPSAGEWLAEAAEQGKLHEPGAEYHDVKVHLQAEPTGELQIDDWAALLPGVKNAEQIVRRITTETAEKARERLSLIKDSAR